jgi:hypothetical protein
MRWIKPYNIFYKFIKPIVNMILILYVLYFVFTNQQPTNLNILFILSLFIIYK